MSGIVVGIDGSTNSGRALEWAVQEAAIRQVPLRVITIFRQAISHWGAGPVTYPQEHALNEWSRKFRR